VCVCVCVCVCACVCVSPGTDPADATDKQPSESGETSVFKRRAKEQQRTREPDHSVRQLLHPHRVYGLLRHDGDKTRVCIDGTEMATRCVASQRFYLFQPARVQPTGDSGCVGGGES
jgi:hypothetical protein